jgi:hypothetical protein
MPQYFLSEVKLQARQNKIIYLPNVDNRLTGVYGVNMESATVPLEDREQIMDIVHFHEHEIT